MVIDHIDVLRRMPPASRTKMSSWNFIPQTLWALVLGNEQKGLSAEQIEACDVTVSLPMRGRVSSLNLAVAAGVLLYELKK